MPALPTGTATFLFADVEGSAGLWEQRAEEMQQALARYDAFMRGAFAAHGGIVFQSAGEAFCVVFPAAHDAVAAAVAAMTGLRDLEGLAASLPVRMALHTGRAEIYGESYLSPPLNRVARLLSAAHGGMIVLSESTRALVDNQLPPQAHLLDRGVHKLRGLSHPERICQVAHPALPAVDLPLHTESEVRHNLPVPLDAFVGRERELDEILRLLQQPDVGLLTLTGPGGCGKTRLALQVANSLPERFADGVWWVDLSSVRQPERVVPALMAVFNLPEQAGFSPLERLVGHLRHQALLLVLDNFEQVVAAADDLAEMLRHCPRVRMLVTSQERLNLSLEHEYPVPSLSLEESVRLFGTRAQQAHPDFAVTERNAADVAAVCRRLEGIPLAVELAAVRVRGMSLAQINHRLDRRFDLLAGMRRDVPDRQRTLRGAVDWSYDLLTREERALFAQVSVFANSFALEAAEAICGGSATPVMDLVFSLCDKSLLRISAASGEGRYTMLQTLRDYGLEKLAAEGSLEEMRRRHALYYLDLLRRADWRRSNEATERVREEMENLRAGMDAAIAIGDDRLVADYALGWRWYFFAHGLFREGIERMGAAEAALRRLDDPQGLCNVLLEAGMLLHQIDEQRADDLGREAEALTRSLESPLLRSRALELLAWGCVDRQQWDEADALLEEAVQQALAAGSEYQAANAMGDRAWAYSQRGDSARAVPLLREVIRLCRKVDNRRNLALNLDRLGGALLETDREEARRCLEEGLERAREVDDEWIAAMICWRLGTLARSEGRLEEAESRYRDGLVRFARMGLCTQPARLMAELVELAVTRGDAHRAARLLALYRAAYLLDAEQPAPPESVSAQAMEAMRADPGEAEMERLCIEAERLEWNEIIARAQEELAGSAGTGAAGVE